MKTVRRYWTHEHVTHRLKSAVRTADNLPRCSPDGYKSIWPPIVRQAHEYMAMCEIQYPRHTPTGKDVDEMLEVMRWVQWLDESERHILWGYATKTPQAVTTKKLGISRATLHRRFTSAVTKIVDHLNDTKGA